MATAKVRRIIEEEVTICDRCKAHKPPMRETLLQTGVGPDQVNWTGVLCDPCSVMIHKRIATKQTRKPKE